PFDPAVTIPPPASAASLAPQEIQSPGLQSQMLEDAHRAKELINPDVMEAASKLVERYERNPLLNRAQVGIGSNWWLVAGANTNTGNAMLANDPHLGLGIPSVFYEIHLTVDSESSPMDVYGVSYAGIPGVILGQNKRISWGATVCQLDVTDIYAESVV